MARRLSFVVVVALCALVLPGAAPPVVYTPGSDSAGDPYFPLDGNGGYDVQHYLLELTYDPDTDVLTGVATIEARAAQNLSAFNLDFVGMTVDSVKVENKDAAWARDDHELTITPSKGIPDKATFKVVIAYGGVPDLVTDELGISGFIPTDDGAVIVGEPHVAATWYPANDHPTDKASFTFRWTVPEGIEVVGNGKLAGQKTQSGWTTWSWDAPDPMATYLATATIGQLDIHAYSAKGLPYWDAIDPVLFEPPPPPPDPPTITPTDGEQMLFSQVSEPAYKRLTRVLTIPSGGATLSFDTFHDTEQSWDFLFVETHSMGGDDWTTLEEQGGHTTQDPGECPDFLDANPFLEHYLTAVEEEPCTSSGTSGEWWAASGDGFEWEPWLFSLPNAGPDPIDLEVSITYASDPGFQLRGVTLDNLVVSTGEGSTSFEEDADTLDGWVVADAPDGSAPNQNSWTTITVLEPPPPPPDPPTITPTDGEQMLFSDVSEPAYKRLTRVLTIPSGGETLTFDTFHDTEPGWDYLFVESRSAGGDDWTTLEEAGGQTSQDVGECPGPLGFNPFLDHYLTPFIVDEGDPGDPDDDEYSCTPSGTSGGWWAASGDGSDWESWEFALPNAGPDPIQVEISITYASDEVFQFRGVTLDNLVVSTGEGSTSFEDDDDVLDGWAVGDAPEGSAPNQNSWTPITVLGPPPPPPPPPPPADSAQASFARQPEMIGFMSSVFGSYPFVTSGGILDNVPFGFALETQTRPTYSPSFFSEGPDDFVVVHELAHQWYGDSLAVEAWQHIWLNEGFATYAEWLWSAREGFGTEQENFDFWYEEVFGEDNESWDLPIGDPGPERLFDFAVYIRGAMTLHVLRNEIGDADFFRLLQRWARSQAGGNVTTDDFIALAEQISGEDLDDLFDAWLFGTDRPDVDAAALRSADNGKGKDNAPKQVRAMLERFGQGYRLDNPAKLRKSGG